MVRGDETKEFENRWETPGVSASPRLGVPSLAMRACAVGQGLNEGPAMAKPRGIRQNRVFRRQHSVNRNPSPVWASFKFLHLIFDRYWSSKDLRYGSRIL